MARIVEYVNGGCVKGECVNGCMYRVTCGLLEWSCKGSEKAAATWPLA